MQLGNLHPLFVHLPIGIIVLAFLMELYYRKKPKPKDNGTILFALGLGAISSLFSAVSGWLLGDGGDYDAEILFRHKWIAIAFTIGTLLLFFLKKSSNKTMQRAYLPFFGVVLALLTLAGHFGGSLTHGEDFLFKEAYEEPIIENVDNARVYAEIIQPIFNKKCTSCHNSSKIKGGLLLTSKSELMAGGDSGSLFDTLEVEKSSLLTHRLKLPIEEKEHMPPKGKVQLTAEEILLMDWWIQQGNCFDCIVKNLPTTDKLDAILSSLEEDTSPKALIAKKVDAVPEDFIASLKEHRISAKLISEEMPLLSVNFLRRKDLTKEDFDLLKKYGDNVVEMNLGHTNLSDELGAQLKSFKHLTKLQLQHTGITAASNVIFEKFEFLTSLNLLNTEVDNSLLEKLVKLPHLKRVFVWQTNITNDALAQFQNKNSELTIQSKIADSIFTASTLAPPVIIADSEIFQDSIKITLEQYFDGAKIFYKTENSKNDTIPKEYTEPFYLKETTKLKSFAVKDDWEPSLPSSADFLKSKVEISSISLVNNPHPKYTGKEGLTLMDLKRGSTNFVDGNWLGYERQHMTAIIELKKAYRVSNVSVGSLSVPGNWIFPPVGYTVWGSTDGTSYKKLKTVKLPKLEPSIIVERNAYDINFDPVLLKKIKILVQSPLKNPEWHQAPGGDSFIFLDEIVLN
ncbi:c-type cytochrome domain-containing protein [Spongiimicrobium sp. 3-5]|uniref:c-type cytochrome domain-containing protein n=1 Tax=Spongiimicrobium sp. 3-5 TaxID=3332596 RepID=UPI0039809146